MMSMKTRKTGGTKRKSELCKKAEAAAEGLIDYVKYLIEREEDWPLPLFGASFDCADCFMENLLAAGETLQDKLKMADLLMHGIASLRLPRDAKPIKNWRIANTKWRASYKRRKK